MISRTTAYRATVALIWALALWHSWTSRGLFVDGANFLVHIARQEAFFDFYDPRYYAMVLGQIPVMIAVTLGNVDLHLLARLLSLGLFGLPTLFYTLALHRTKDDPVLLAIVIAAIGLVFMTTSFFIVGEYNTLYAIVILMGVRLATAERLTTVDGVVLALLALLSIRIYETMIYLGPLLCLIILWKVWRAPARPIVATALYLLAAVFAIRGMTVAIYSVTHPHQPEHLEEVWVMAINFWQNLQFDFALGATLVVVAWALIKPADLINNRPYRYALVLLALLALSPLLALTDGLVRPLAKSQYVARTVSGLIIGTMVVVCVAYRARPAVRLPVFAVLRQPVAAKRFLSFSFLMLLAGIPADLQLTQSWVGYLDNIRTTIRERSGIIPVEETPLARQPYSLFIENWVLTSQSVLLRAKPTDGVLAPPRTYVNEWVPFPPEELPNMGRFYWRD
jgi:hypothetical protein